MKKLKAKHYFILFAICVAIVTAVVALTMGRDLATNQSDSRHQRYHQQCAFMVLQAAYR